jgi:hypothetical protein
VIAAFRKDAGTQLFGFLVVCNFDIHLPHQIGVDLSSFLGSEGPFTCTDLLSGERQEFPLSRLELMLSPCTAKVLKFYRGNVK